MESRDKSSLRRDQARVDAIGHSLNNSKLLAVEDIRTIVHDMGDIEDWAIMFPGILDSIKTCLENLSLAPRTCFDEINCLRGWFEELRYHMNSVEPLVTRICNAIQQRYPDEFPWLKEDEP